jgi:hypothetical protein
MFDLCLRYGSLVLTSMCPTMPYGLSSSVTRAFILLNGTWGPEAVLTI